MADYTVPPYEYTARQEQNQRRRQSEINQRLATVSPEYGPIVAQDARDDAAERLGRRRGRSE